MQSPDIKEIRKRLNMSQEQLATSLGVAVKTVRNWENGGTIPKSKYSAIREIALRNQDGSTTFFEAIESPGAGSGNEVGLSPTDFKEILTEMKLQREGFMTQLERRDKQIEELIGIVKTFTKSN